MAPEPSYVEGDEAAEIRALLNRCGLTWQVPPLGRKRTPVAEAIEHTCVRLDNHPGPCLCGCGALGGEPHSDREDAASWHAEAAHTCTLDHTGMYAQLGSDCNGWPRPDCPRRAE